MNGAEALVRTLASAGVEMCFTNPGTSELHFVAALERVRGMRSVLGLFEGVVSGAADGYGRMAERPAATLLHLGPGLANGLANFHNARKARTPIVSIVGDHATTHRRFDAPLTSDVEAIARPVSAWVRSARSSRELAADAAAAVAAAVTPPGQIATLIVPADAAWGESGGPAPPAPADRPRAVAPERVAAAAAALRSGEPALLLLGGRALRARALETASRIAAASHARLYCDTFNARLERGAGRARIQSLPYFPEGALKALAGMRHLVTVGTQPPVSFFAYPDQPSWLAPEDCAIHSLADPAEDAAAALEVLAEEVGAQRQTPELEPLERPTPPRGALDAAAVGRSLAALLPEGAIVADESITASAALIPATRGAPPHDWLALTGGAIGQGLPLATGASLACPRRRVVCLEGDGSAMYTLQALWTQARESLDVTTVILANRRYAILEVELARMGVPEPGPRLANMLGIGRPELRWVELARGLGVPATRAVSAEEFHRELAASLARPGPSLIEAVL
jgi:acetolactate synthase-1/2/3 large subunit